MIEGRRVSSSVHLSRRISRNPPSCTISLSNNGQFVALYTIFHSCPPPIHHTVTYSSWYVRFLISQANETGTAMTGTTTLYGVISNNIWLSELPYPPSQAHYFREHHNKCATHPAHFPQNSTNTSLPP
jgi:hypothetical protein